MHWGAAGVKHGTPRMLVTLIRELGFVDACFYVVDRLSSALSGKRARLHKYHFMAQPVAASPWLPPRRGAHFEVRRLHRGDPALRIFPRSERAFPHRFDQGAVCLAAFKSQEPIGFLWLSLGPYQEDEVRCRYVPLPQGKAAWDFDVYITPEHRSSPVFLRLWDEANHLLRSQGVGWSFSRVSAFNPLSAASHSRMGAFRIGAAVFATFGRWQLSVASLPPYLHLSRHSASVPEFQLNPKPAAGRETFAADA